MIRISIIVPTRNRPKDLADLLLTILNQSHPLFEVIIIDDSPLCSAKPVADVFSSKFKFIGCKLEYVKGNGEGLTAAKNLGVRIFKGDAVLFLDDDSLLDQNTVRALAIFLRDNPGVTGVQPEILSSTMISRKEGLSTRFENAVYKVLMLTYRAENMQTVRRSGMSVFPTSIGKIIAVQRLSGSCCYRREIFSKLSFDTKLKRWGFMEDLDFSLRLNKMYPQSLYAIPHVKIIHKESGEARLPTKLTIYMSTIYWFYVFFKDIFEGSIINLVAFLWALVGNLASNLGGFLIKKKKRRNWWPMIFLLISYITAFRNLKNILILKLDFFNENFK